MKHKLEIKLGSPSDLPMAWEHIRGFNKNNETIKEKIFSPLEDPWEPPKQDWVKRKEKSTSVDPTESGWERIWILTKDQRIVGNLRLSHHIGLKTTLHRAMLMMGLEAEYRNKGYGSKLLESAIQWTQEQPSLDWISLNVFSYNLGAIALYEKFGFQKIGINEDLFRVYGHSIDDIEMSLKVTQK